MKHPAKYSNAFLPIFKNKLEGYERILDPFAGTGKLKEVRSDAVLLEIEFDWANCLYGDALNMPFRDNSFNAICTSPTYGNRMADNFECKKGYKRNTYRHCLGKKLKMNNSGHMQWGPKYKEFHEKAWSECKRVLKNNGLFILNISDHIRKGGQIFVTDWHIDTLQNLGFKVKEHIKDETKRMKFGANSHPRVPYESIIIFDSLL